MIQSTQALPYHICSALFCKEYQKIGISILDGKSFFQINTVVRTDHTMQQWLDLGNQSQACITVPETCGTQGGTISVWIKPLDCQSGVESSVVNFKLSQLL